MIELVVTGVVALICGGIIGHYVGRNPAAESSAMTVVRTELAALRDSLESFGSKVESAIKPPEPTPTPPVAPVVAPTPVIPWTIGDSYSNLGALAADIKRPDFKREIRIDGVPVFNIGGTSPLDFYSVAGILTTTKP